MSLAHLKYILRKRMRELREENENCFSKLRLLRVIHVTHIKLSVIISRLLVMSSFSVRFILLCLFLISSTSIYILVFMK